MVSSILTNNGAMTALQSLQATQKTYLKINGLSLFGML